MSKDLISKYIWIVDTIQRYGKVTLAQLQELWQKSTFGQDGSRLTRRTFYNYRQGIAEAFQVEIEASPGSAEYYIAQDSHAKTSVTNWLLNTAAMSDALTMAGDVKGRIFVEDIPTARSFLAIVVQALRELRLLRFDYLPFTRVIPKEVTIKPYFLKLFRQRWYVTGLNTDDQKVKTYALDRMFKTNVLEDTFLLPSDFDPEEYFKYAYGIVFDEGEPRTVELRTDTQRAKYLRALPLHHTQSESVHDHYSVFTYKLKLTHDLVQEIVSYGPSVTVLGPPELRAMVTDMLHKTLDQYII